MEGITGHPKNIIMLTCDAFGVMPPIARLNPLQARYHFLSGYTAKVAGTEKGVTEPSATFSACFGAPFMTLNPTVYSRLLGEKIKKHDVKCWLVNTGWIKGPYGVGSRIDIKHSRALIKAALQGELDDVPMRQDPIFGFQVPESCPNVPQDILNPRNTWADPKEYDAKARELAGQFKENFQQFESAPDEVKEVGPVV
jgi:phosphoenolpyruvate carboxykinase (ATP)